MLPVKSIFRSRGPRKDRKFHRMNPQSFLKLQMLLFKSDYLGKRKRGKTPNAVILTNQR